MCVCACVGAAEFERNPGRPQTQFRVLRIQGTPMLVAVVLFLMNKCEKLKFYVVFYILFRDVLTLKNPVVTALQHL